MAQIGLPHASLPTPCADRHPLPHLRHDPCHQRTSAWRLCRRTEMESSPDPCPGGNSGLHPLRRRGHDRETPPLAMDIPVTLRISLDQNLRDSIARRQLGIPNLAQGVSSFSGRGAEIAELQSQEACKRSELRCSSRNSSAAAVNLRQAQNDEEMRSRRKRRYSLRSWIESNFSSPSMMSLITTRWSPLSASFWSRRYFSAFFSLDSKFSEKGCTIGCTPQRRVI